MSQNLLLHRSANEVNFPRNGTCGVDTPGVKGARDLSSLRPPEGSNESENGGEGGQEGTVTHRSKMNPQQWPKQGAGV